MTLPRLLSARATVRARRQPQIAVSALLALAALLAVNAVGVLLSA